MTTLAADDDMDEGEDTATNGNKVRKWLTTSDDELGNNVRKASTTARKKQKGNDGSVSIGLTTLDSGEGTAVQIPKVATVDLIKEHAMSKYERRGTTSVQITEAMTKGVGRNDVHMDVEDSEMEDKPASKINARPTKLKTKASQKVSESKLQG